MITPPTTRLALELARPDFTDHITDLAAAFHDQTVTFRLRGCGTSAPADIGAHLRRSFLGALGAAASPAAIGNLPCTWDPPCALDVFCREQLRGPQGDGLPKPYVIRHAAFEGDLLVSLRIFGMANDWFMAAAEAMVTGMRNILPWQRLYSARTSAPEILSRDVQIGAPAAGLPETRAVAVVFLTATDTGGAFPAHEPHRIVSRLLRRVDGLSRWNGLALEPSAGKAFAEYARTLDYDTSGLRRGRYESPNAKGQVRAKATMSGTLGISGDIAPLLPVLAMGERCHLGRGAVEGLGVFRVDAL